MQVALAQISATADVAANLELVRSYTAAAAECGARLVVLPEAAMACFGTRLAAVAEPTDGPFATAVAAAADAAGVTVIAGMFEPADDGRIHNTLIARGSGVHADYRKIHLFDAFDHRESEAVAPGDDLVTITVDDLTIGLATCYDVRFAGMFQRLGDLGVHAVALPASWGAGEGKTDQWRTLVRARALDTTAYLLAADQALVADARAPRGVGHSMVVSPLGGVLAELEDEPGLLLAEIDGAQAEEARRSVPVLRSRIW